MPCVLFLLCSHIPFLWHRKVTSPSLRHHEQNPRDVEKELAKLSEQMSIIDIAKRSIITIKINQIKSYHSLSERWKWLIGLHINKSSDVPHLTRVLLKKTKQRIGYESRWLDPQNEPTPQKNPKDDPSFWEENSPFSRRLRQGPSHWGVLTRPQDPAVHSRARARNRCRPIYWLANAATCTKIIYGDLDEKGMDGLTKWGSHLRDEFNMWLLYVYIYIYTLYTVYIQFWFWDD